MTVPVLPDLNFLPQSTNDSTPVRELAACLQEQFIGPLPLRCERPAAELLAERLAEPDFSPALFIP